MDHSELGLLTPSLHNASRDVALVVANIKMTARGGFTTTDHS